MSTTTDTFPAPPPPHILVFPYPAQGHMLALLDLTHQLCLRGVTITVLVTPQNLPILSPLLAAHPSAVATLVLPFPSHPDLPPGVENVKDTGNAGNFPIIAALSRLREPIINWFESNPSPPAAIISDFFLGWTVELARRLEVPRIAFFSVSAFLISVLDHCWRNVDAVRSSNFVDFPDLPRAPSFTAAHLPSIFKRYQESDPNSAVVRSGMVANMESWGFVFNSIDRLEDDYLDYLTRKTGHNRVFRVGPLNLMAIENHGGSDPDQGAAILTWLDGCPDGSVLYICFGSQKLLKNEQMEALASGLERSGTRFVWVVVANPKDGYGAVPSGFEERVGSWGLVVRGWVPQKSILNHWAVGGFLSHCGWNSVQEAVASGVMILGWPMEADQFVNAKLLVEDMGAAVRVCDGSDAVPDPEKLGRTIGETIGRETTQKTKAKKLRDKAYAAVRSDGSSSRELDKLVRELSLLKVGGG